MDGDTRSAAFREVLALPGGSTRQLAERLGVSEWTMDYHLRRLAKSGAVARAGSGRGSAWFATSCGFCPVLRAATPALRRAEALAIARAADETPVPARLLAERAGVPTGTVRWVSGILCDAFILERTRLGRLALREGAETCIARAAAGQGCDQWGKCPVSHAWRSKGGAPAASPPRP